MEETENMKKQIGYKLGYRIIIRNSFYEVTEGKRAIYYGQCRKNSTIQEIVNKTILLDLGNERNETRLSTKERYRNGGKRKCLTQNILI